MQYTPAIGDRVAYLGNELIELGTVNGLHPDLDDGDLVAFTVEWDNGFDDQGYWHLGDGAEIRPVRS